MRVQAADGWSLEVGVHAPGRPTLGVVIAIHAMMADARSMRPLARTLASEGFEVWRPDLRGRGGSGPTPREGGTWSYDDLVRYDLCALVRAARQRRLPVTVVGHSLGGHVAAAAAAEGLAIDNLVLLAGNVWLRSTEPSRRLRARKAAVLAAWEAITRGAGQFPSRRFRLGPADEAAPYVRDLCRFYREDRWAARDGTDWWAALPRVEGRILAIAGAGDRLLARPESVRLFVDRFGPGRVDFWLAAKGRFGLQLDPGHMALGCDPACDGLWREIAGWITRDRDPRTGSAAAG